MPCEIDLPSIVLEAGGLSGFISGVFVTDFLSFRLHYHILSQSGSRAGNLIDGNSVRSSVTKDQSFS